MATATKTKKKKAAAGRLRALCKANLKRARGRSWPRPIRCEAYVQVLELLVLLMDEHAIESPTGSDVAMFVENVGTSADRADLLSAVAPIAQRLVDRRGEPKE